MCASKLCHWSAGCAAITCWLTVFISDGFAAGEPTSFDARPNIVVILADDLGYGDVTPNNPSSKIATPAFAELAAEGVNFSDAHSPSAVCTPTRYGLLCGRYCWRTRLKKSVLGGSSRELLASDRPTIGTMLQQAGYRTACVGKWHLGLGWQTIGGNQEADKRRQVPEREIDFEQPLTDGPNQHGFDESYIIPASLDMAPYVYLANGRATALPKASIPNSKFPNYFRGGRIASDFEHVDCLNRLLSQANGFIRRSSDVGTSAGKADLPKPFFLYFPMPAPHKPVAPNRDFRGTTGLGSYGDFVAQVDWTVGEVLKTLDECGVSDNTIVIVTSDNGSFMRRVVKAGETRDHTADNSIEAYLPNNHRPNGNLRGTKADIFEAGHRVPLLVRWPGRIKPKTVVEQTVCLTDLMATIAELVDADFDRKSAEDSFSFAPLLGSLEPNNDADVAFSRPPVINHSISGMFAIRDGNWKLILGNGSGGRAQPRGKPFEEPYQLFDLAADPAEQTNLVDQHPERVRSMVEAFEQLAHGDHLQPASSPNATNDHSDAAKTEVNPH